MTEVHAQNRDAAVFDLSGGTQNGAVAAQHYGKIEVVDIFDAALEKLGRSAEVVRIESGELDALGSQVHLEEQR